MDKQEWLLKRNCCLSPRQLGGVYGMLCLASFLVAAAFAMAGAWQIFIFSAIEMTAVGIAFLAYARHATDHERIALSADCLLIEQVKAGTVQQTRLNPYRTRVVSPRDPGDLIHIEADGVKMELGRFVTAARRDRVARELRVCVGAGGNIVRCRL